MNLERAILEVLDAAERQAPEYLLPEEKLFREAWLFVGHDVTRSEFDAALQELERKKQIYLDRHEDKGRLAKLTAQGRARVRT